MTKSQKWMLATVLLCLSAAVAQRVRAQEVLPVPAPTPVGVWPGDAAGAPAAPAADRHARPGDGTGPAEQASFDRSMVEAELAYRSGDDQRALSAFSRLVEIDRLSVRAWLRLGNLHQRAGRAEEAVAAYRSATLGVPQSAMDEDARDKAFANLALLGIEQARSAIDALEDRGSSRVRAASSQVTRQLRSERRRYDRLDARPRGAAQPGTRTRQPSQADAGPVVAPVPTPAVTAVPLPHAVTKPPAVPETRPEAERPFEPYTVDRWIATPRGSARRPARPALSEPVVEDPLPRPPSVEYFHATPADPPRPAR
jgi:hypothetical protein